MTRRPVMCRIGGRKVPVLVKVKGGYRPATMAEVRRAKRGRVLKRNPTYSISRPGGWGPSGERLREFPSMRAAVSHARWIVPPGERVTVTDVEKSAAQRANRKKRNPQWLQGSVPHTVAGIGSVQRFRDSSGKLKGELFPGDRLLVHNPRRKRARAAKHKTRKRPRR